MLGDEWVLALVCVVVYFGAGRQEARMGGHDHAALWAALSIAVSALGIFGLHGTWGWLLAAQIALFVGIGVFRAWRG